MVYIYIYRERFMGNPMEKSMQHFYGNLDHRVVSMRYMSYCQY